MDDPRPDPLAAATAFVASTFLEANAAFVGGSALTDDRTPTSDIDTVVLLDGAPAPYRETHEHQGWTVEAFVHTRESLQEYWEKDAARRRCSLARMCAEGVVVQDRAGVANAVQAAAAAWIAAGPPPLSAADLDRLRYALTDMLEDMAGCSRRDEMVYIAALVVSQAASLALATAGRWDGIGKALARELRRADPELAERLIDGHRRAVTQGDTSVLHQAAADVLLRVGGPLLVGYRVQG